MDKRYIAIRGKEYRVEINWNTVEDFARMKGLHISDALALSLQDGDTMKVMMTAALREGERLDGRTFDLTPVQVGEMISLANVNEFVQIYRQQYLGEDEGKPSSAKDDGKKKGRIRTAN